MASTTVETESVVTLIAVNIKLTANEARVLHDLVANIGGGHGTPLMISENIKTHPDAVREVTDNLYHSLSIIFTTLSTTLARDKY